MRGSLRSLTLIAVACLGAMAAGRAQTFTAKSDLVVLQVGVQDRRSMPVADLTRAQFRVLEDQVPQDIRLFLNEDRPVAVGLVVDSSMSMTTKRAGVIAAAEAFARSSNPKDALFTVAFNEQPSLGLPTGTDFTSELSVLHDALSRIGALGQTALFDALGLALDHVNISPLDQKVLIVVSDGDDNRSLLKFNDVLNRAQRSNAVIYAIGLFDEIQGGDRRILRRLSDATGGAAYFPKSVRDVGSALDTIGRDIRHRYTLGYVSTNTRRDGTFRKITVEATEPATRKALTVRVRTGYIAPLDPTAR